MNYTKAVEYIENIPRFAIADPLVHAKELMHRLGDPQNSLKVIHVAGTNGKGSVCAYLAAMLQEGGYECGLFTSPHLLKVNERFTINEELMSDETFLRLFLRVKKVIDEFGQEGREHPSFFEVVFAIGMLHFQERNVDYAVLETGLGGKLDATNTVAKPLACVITSISLDHTEYLGDTLEKIAGEKAGIIKEGIPVIYDAQNQQTAAVITKRAAKLSCPVYPLAESMYEMQQNTTQGIDFSFCYKYYSNITVFIPSIAAYQMSNASLALLTMLVLCGVHKIPTAVLCRGIGQTKWEGRMETLMPGVIADGAHNEDGVRRFIETACYFRNDYRITILFSAVADKKYRDMIGMICRELRPDAVIATQIEGERIVSAAELAAIFSEYGCARVYMQPDVSRAFEEGYRIKEDGLLFCVGSLYLIGEIKRYLRQKGKCDL